MGANAVKDEVVSGGVGREREIYDRRFTDAQDQAKELLWARLCQNFFQKFIPENAAVADVGSGDGKFIRHIKASRKVAVDISPHADALAAQGIEVLKCSATEFDQHLDQKVDIVFMSNFLEHLPEKSLVLRVLEASNRALNPGGKVVILQPNIRYVGMDYWDYIDHHIALNERSLVEALDICGYQVEKLVPRFLPYTVKSKLGNFTGLINLYLKMPFLWRIFGQQTFVVARKL